VYSKGYLKAELDLWEDEYKSWEVNNKDNEDKDEVDDKDNSDYKHSENNNSENKAVEKIEENWKCVICDFNFSSCKTLISHFKRHKKAQYFNIKKLY
jgi:hypothetical protein